MAKGAYIGINGVARQVKKPYAGAYFDGYAGHPECIVSTAEYALFTYSGRNYKKKNAGEAYCASVIRSGWLHPLIVAKTAESVYYYTDGNHNMTELGVASVSFCGEKWYVCGNGAAYKTTINPNGNVVHLNAITGVDSYDSREEAALDFLTYAVPRPAGDHIARLVTTGYIGVNGVARRFF